MASALQLTTAGRSGNPHNTRPAGFQGRKRLGQATLGAFFYFPSIALEQIVKKVSKKTVTKKTKLPYVIVRCKDAGVHAGEYVRHTGREVVLTNARRIWYWQGAASLSEIAVHGCKYPGECKITLAVSRLTLTEACEIIECLPEGEQFLRKVTAWKA
jgi:hypothetical protein